MRSLTRLLLVLLLCTFSHAASTKFVSVFRNPMSGAIDFSGKVACFVIIPRDEIRSAREETIAAELRSRGMDTFAGYTVVPSQLVKDREKAKEFLQKSGIRTAVLMRLVGDEERTSVSTMYTQPYYSSFWGYWNYGWASAYATETVWTDRVVTLETLIYSIEKNTLLWAGRSETTNPKDILKFVKDLADAAGKELRKEGLIPKKN